MAMLEFRTPGFHPYAVKYSPYLDSRLAVASASNFGIVGNGRLFIVGLTPQGAVAEATYNTNDTQYDVAFSEINESQTIVSCGDGSLRLYDVKVPDFPVMVFQEHKREALSVAWNPTSRDVFASSSWDGTLKLWSPTRYESLRTIPIGSCTYDVSFSPQEPSILSAVSSDSFLRIYDLRTPVSAKYHLVQSIPVHGGGGSDAVPPRAAVPPSEVLCHDWNKYDPTKIATGSVDCLGRVFDIRNPEAGPETILRGHNYALRNLAWSPLHRDRLLTGGYDMTVRLWQTGPAEAVPLGLMNRHTEFVMGLDWCIFGTGGWVASAAWDERVLLWDSNALTRQQANDDHLRLYASLSPVHKQYKHPR